MTSKKKYREKNDTSLDTNSYETDANEKKKLGIFPSSILRLGQVHLTTKK